MTRLSACVFLLSVLLAGCAAPPQVHTIPIPGAANKPYVRAQFDARGGLLVQVAEDMYRATGSADGYRLPKLGPLPEFKDRSITAFTYHVTDRPGIWVAIRGRLLFEDGPPGSDKKKTTLLKNPYLLDLNTASPGAELRLTEPDAQVGLAPVESVEQHSIYYHTYFVHDAMVAADGTVRTVEKMFEKYLVLSAETYSHGVLASSQSIWPPEETKELPRGDDWKDYRYFGSAYGRVVVADGTTFWTYDLKAGRTTIRKPDWTQRFVGLPSPTPYHISHLWALAVWTTPAVCSADGDHVAADFIERPTTVDPPGRKDQGPEVRVGVYVWDLARGRELFYPQWSGELCFNPVCRDQLVLGTREGDLYALDLREAAPQFRKVLSVPHQIRTICFSPDGKKLVLGGLGHLALVTSWSDQVK